MAVVSYPDGDEAADGTLRVIHDRGRYDADAREIVLSRCREADALAGRRR